VLQGRYVHLKVSQNEFVWDQDRPFYPCSADAVPDFWNLHPRPSYSVAKYLAQCPHAGSHITNLCPAKPWRNSMLPGYLHWIFCSLQTWLQSESGLMLDISALTSIEPVCPYSNNHASSLSTFSGYGQSIKGKVLIQISISRIFQTK
jgi:hypothetical protein